MPEQPAADAHRHRCPMCGHVWEHGADSYGDERAHRCALCGDVHPARRARVAFGLLPAVDDGGLAGVFGGD